MDYLIFELGHVRCYKMANSEYRNETADRAYNDFSVALYLTQEVILERVYSQNKQ